MGTLSKVNSEKAMWLWQIINGRPFSIDFNDPYNSFRIEVSCPGFEALWQSWNLQVYLLQVLHLFFWNLPLLLTGEPSI